jgi:dUTP pyrophosphatase
MTKTIEMQVYKHKSANDLPLPKYATDGSSGMDLYAHVEEPVVLSKGTRKLIPTGISIAIPKGFEAQVRPRSGLAIKHGITVLNTPGTVDSDYRGEIMVILCNLSDTDFTIERGMRIAQMIIAPVAHAHISLVNSLDDTDRGTGGFGSTGIK